MNMKINTSENAPEEGTQILAKVMYGDRIVCGIGHYSVIKHKDSKGNTVDITEAFIVDAGCVMYQWENILAWTPYKPLVSAEFQYNFNDYDKKFHATIKRVADEWNMEIYRRAEARSEANHAN